MKKPAITLTPGTEVRTRDRLDAAPTEVLKAYLARRKPNSNGTITGLAPTHDSVYLVDHGGDFPAAYHFAEFELAVTLEDPKVVATAMASQRQDVSRLGFEQGAWEGIRERDQQYAAWLTDRIKTAEEQAESFMDAAVRGKTEADRSAARLTRATLRGELAAWRALKDAITRWT